MRYYAMDLGILLADDEAVERAYLERLLSARFPNSRIFSDARNGQEAVAIAQKESIDVAILDICMPLMDGLQAAVQLHRINPQMHILVNTAFADFDFAKRAIDSHVDAYLLKPSSEDEIVGEIRRLLRQDEERELQEAAEQVSMEALLLERPPYSYKERFLNSLRSGRSSEMFLSFSALWRKMEAVETLSVLKLSLIELVDAINGILLEANAQPQWVYGPFLRNSLERCLSKKELLRLSERYITTHLNLMQMHEQKEGRSLVDQVDAYISKRYEKAITLDDLAQIFYHNGEYLSRLYRQQMGQSINQRMHELRIAKACELLQGKHRSIESVANAVGYKTLSHFYKCFRRLKHQTPRAYQREAEG